MTTEVFKTGLAFGLLLLLRSSIKAEENPYNRIYQRCIQQMGVPDSLGESIPDVSAGQLNRSILLVAGSKTCSQRCSTTCSTSCTTSRGCSSNCKKQTDGCGGGSLPFTSPPPSPRPSERIPNAEPPRKSTPRQLSSNSLSGRVVAVIEGDLISIVKPDETEVSIRLAGIDAPEMEQPFGDQAKKLLSEKVLDQKVTVKLRANRDPDAASGAVYLGLRWINSEMVEEGMAWCVKDSAPDFDANENRKLVKSEETAKTDKVGLWASEDPVPPWEFRKNGDAAETLNRSTASQGDTTGVSTKGKPAPDVADHAKKLQRQFTDSTGVFRVDGTAVSFADGSVSLVRQDNRQVVNVPISRLCTADQTWLKENAGYISKNGPSVLKYLQK